MKFLNVNLGLNPGTFLLAAGAFLLGPTLIAAAGGVLRSLTKAGIKGSLLACERVKELAAGTKESIEDITAEARAEVGAATKTAPSKKA